MSDVSTRSGVTRPRCFVLPVAVSNGAYNDRGLELPTNRDGPIGKALFPIHVAQQHDMYALFQDQSVRRQPGRLQRV